MEKSSTSSDSPKPAEFSASLDRLTKIITTIVTIVFGSIVILGVTAAITEQEYGVVWVSVVTAAFYGIVWMYRPLRYTIGEKAVIIHRPFDKVIFPKADITEVALVESRSIRFALRTFGVGGIFGYFGSFYTSALGGMTWYLTRLDRAVLIRTKKAKILVSPDDRQRFIDALTS